MVAAVRLEQTKMQSPSRRPIHLAGGVVAALGALACTRAVNAPRPAAAIPVASVHLASAADQFVNVDAFRIRYREIGHGQPVVLLHGRSASLETWRALADSLALEYHVVALDFRGAGQSTKSAQSSDYGPKMANDVIGVMDHLHIARAHLVGHSLGALIAAYVAAHYPERVATVSLLAGAFFPDSASFFTARTEAYLQALESGDLRAYYRSRGESDSVAAALSARFLRTNVLPSLAASTRAATGLVLPPEFVSRNTVPTLVAVGTRDDNLEVDRQFVRRWPRARLLEVQGADHGAIIERAETLHAIRELLRLVAAPVSRTGSSLVDKLANLHHRRAPWPPNSASKPRSRSATRTGSNPRVAPRGQRPVRHLLVRLRRLRDARRSAAVHGGQHDR